MAMPQPGNRYAQAFTVQPGKCWAMVHDCQGRRPLPRDAFVDRALVQPRRRSWWRVWSYPEHLDGLTGLREFGGRSR